MATGTNRIVFGSTRKQYQSTTKGTSLDLGHTPIGKWPSDLAKTRLQWTHLLSGPLTSFFVWIDNDRHGIVRKKWKPIPSYESYHILWQVFPMQLSNHKIGAHPHVQTHSYHLLGYIFSCNFRKLVDMIFRIYIYIFVIYICYMYIYISIYTHNIMYIYIYLYT